MVMLMMMMMTEVTLCLYYSSLILVLSLVSKAVVLGAGTVCGSNIESGH